MMTARAEGRSGRLHVSRDASGQTRCKRPGGLLGESGTDRRLHIVVFVQLVSSDDNLVWYRAINMHTVNHPTGLSCMRLHTFHFLDDHGVLPGTRTGREPPARRCDLPVWQTIDPKST